MVKIFSWIISVLVLDAGYCDLIGFNRLGNNVNSHRRYRNPKTLRTRYKNQIYRWMAKPNDDMVPNDKPVIRKSTKSERTQNKNNTRLNLYKKRMGTLQ